MPFSYIYLFINLLQMVVSEDIGRQVLTYGERYGLSLEIYSFGDLRLHALIN